MRRIATVLAATLLAGVLVVPGARPAAADSVCPEWDHFFTSTLSFPAGFWSEGRHEITFAVDPYFSHTYRFVVDDGAPLYPGAVLMTPQTERRMDLVAADHVLPAAINPMQETVAREVVVGDMEFLLWAHNDTIETISWDGGPAVQTHYGGISSSCVYGGPNKTTLSEWLRAYGPKLP